MCRIQLFSKQLTVSFRYKSGIGNHIGVYHKRVTSIFVALITQYYVLFLNYMKYSINPKGPRSLDNCAMKNLCIYWTIILKIRSSLGTCQCFIEEEIILMIKSIFSWKSK